jgi:hypothetical protein
MTSLVMHRVIRHRPLACCVALLLLVGCRSRFPERPTEGPRWRTTQRDGVHWLVTPEGALFYSKGVNFVDGGKETALAKEMKAYFWRNFFPTLEAWQSAVGRQLSGWGFNTRGGWSDPSPRIGLALTVELDLGRRAGFHWFDPFDPEMEDKVLQWASTLTRPYVGHPNLIGYFTDNEVGWWNSPLFVWYLNKGWENHTKRLLWDLLYKEYGGSWERLLADWVPQGGLRGFEDLKGPSASLRLRAGGNGIRIVDRFLYLCARRYYELMHKALRTAHPAALILGDRLPLYYHQDAVRALDDYVDVVSTNYNVDTPDGWVAPYYFEGLCRLTGKPVLVTEFFFAALENRSGNQNKTQRKAHAKPGHLMTVATQRERAAGLANALRNFARFPNVVGAHWFQYSDEPFGGREDGEDYNFGLVDNADRPYEEVTRVFSELNPRLEELHRKAQARPAGGVRGACGTPSRAGDEHGRVPVTEALHPIDLCDQTLADWDKEATRLEGFVAQEPYVPFGDVHLAWRPEGIYVAVIANTYVDPTFMAYSGDFPAPEAFNLRLALEAGQADRTDVTIFLVPRLDERCADGFDLLPVVDYRRAGSPLEKAPRAVGVTVQRIEKSLPHVMLEAFLPCESFGIPRLSAGMDLKIGIAVTTFYRELTMVWSPDPATGTSANLRSLTGVVLQGRDDNDGPGPSSSRPDRR